MEQSKKFSISSPLRPLDNVQHVLVEYCRLVYAVGDGSATTVECLLHHSLGRDAAGYELLGASLADMPVLAMKTPEIATGRVNAEVQVAWDHVIHRLELDRVNLEASWLSVGQSIELPSSVLPHSTEPPLPFRNEASSEAKLTPQLLILLSLIPHCLL